MPPLSTGCRDDEDLKDYNNNYSMKAARRRSPIYINDDEELERTNNQLREARTTADVENLCKAAKKGELFAGAINNMPLPPCLSLLASRVALAKLLVYLLSIVNNLQIA